jgi:hypothetical protein
VLVDDNERALEIERLMEQLSGDVALVELMPPGQTLRVTPAMEAWHRGSRLVD